MYKSKIKKLLAAAGAAVMLFGTATLMPNEYSVLKSNIVTEAASGSNKGSCGKNATYSFNSSTGVLTISGTGSTDDYYTIAGVVPPWYDCTDYLSKIKKVVVEKGITRIGDSAFVGCDNLTEVSLPSGLKEIGELAFAYNDKLAKVNLPDSITSIKDYAFYICSNLSGITLPSNLTELGYCSFSGCSTLTKITIPKTLKTIGSSAFYNCSKLSSVTIPSSVTYIEGMAFHETPWLNSKRKSNPLVVVNNILIDAQTAAGKVNIPNGTVSISGYAFYANEYITSVNIPAGVKRIGEVAFVGCSKLTEINIPEGVTTIEGLAFNDCSNLKKITIPSSVTSIGEKAFDYTPWMKDMQKSTDQVIVNGILINAENAKGKVVISNKVKDIADGVFSETPDVTEVTFPNSVTRIGNKAFWGCAKISSINIPNSVKTIGDKAFSNCESLKTLTLPNSVKTIGDEAFLSTSLKSITIPESLTQIGVRAFGYQEAYNDNPNKMYGKTPNFKITCYSGTAGEKYAKNNGFSYTVKENSGNISSCTISIPYSSYTYRGRGIKPSVTVKDGTKKLTKGTDYTVSYSNNTNIGTATITVTGKGKYLGTAKKTFTVKALGLSSSYAKISIPYSSYTYSGSAIKPKVTVKFKDGDVIPTSYYTLSYSNNVKVGTATITVKGKGTNVTGTYKKTFVVKPAKNEITSISSTKGAFKISWKKGTAGTVGYQVLYSRDKAALEKAVGEVTSTSAAKYVHSYTSTDLSDLSENFSKYPNSGETWYVKVRSFVTKDGKASSTRYGNYSAVKSVKVK